MSILRYAGGKSRGLAKKIAPRVKVPKNGTYCEPFCGGASVALLVASAYPKARIVLNDLDPEVAAFWRVVVTDNLQQFITFTHRIRTCDPTVEQFREYQTSIPLDPVERAFRFLFLNRTSRVESNGKRPLGGWAQQKPDIGSRWRPDNLIRELLAARKLLAGRTEVLNQDFAEVMKAADSSWVFYCDPPYYKAGNSLYNFPWSDEDHVRLRDLLHSTPGNWVLSYDAHPRISALYEKSNYQELPAHYSMKKRKENEAVIVPYKRRGHPTRGGHLYGAGETWDVPKNFAEFYERYPGFVHSWTSRKLRWSKAKHEKNGCNVFDMTLEDYTQDMLKFLMALPEKSKYRAMGFTDPIQLFDPSKWGGVSSAKFFAWIKSLLANKFMTIRTKEFKDALPNANDHLGMVREHWELDLWQLDARKMRRFVEAERPSLLVCFDLSFGHGALGYGEDHSADMARKKSRLLRLLRQRFLLGQTVSPRKEYKTRSTRAASASK